MTESLRPDPRSLDFILSGLPMCTLYFTLLFSQFTCPSACLQWTIHANIFKTTSQPFTLPSCFLIPSLRRVPNRSPLHSLTAHALSSHSPAAFSNSSNAPLLPSSPALYSHETMQASFNPSLSSTSTPFSYPTESTAESLTLQLHTHLPDSLDTLLSHASPHHATSLYALAESLATTSALTVAAASDSLTAVVTTPERAGAGWLAPLVNTLEKTLYYIQNQLELLHVPYSYGFSIILLTLVVKIATYPLTKQQVSLHL